MLYDMAHESGPETMYDRILVPTDGSAGSEVAIEHAIALARTFDASLHGLYVVETDRGPAEVEMAELLDALEAVGRDAMTDLQERARAAGLETVEGTVARGTPHRAILEYADQKDIDLIVMGTHGRTGLDRYLLGSVTEKVVRMAEVPVTTVRMEPQE